tara:strand:+ start:310 stop:951 length:642 start_codon:yes stop_codon:yes gene_type:complete
MMRDSGNNVRRSEWVSRLPLISYLWLVVTILIAGLFYPDYSHVSQYMSELGATGAPNAWLVNYFGFVPTELLLLMFLAMALPVLPRVVLTRLGIGLIGLYALLLIGTSVFACDFECRPVQQASFAHDLHITLATFAYPAGIIGVLVTSISARQWPGGFNLMMSGIVVAILTCGLLLNLNPALPQLGLVQRAVETLLYVWFILLGRTTARLAQT